MTEHILTETEASRLSSAALAYLGDSVLEILVRERLVIYGVKNPSVASLSFVTAAAQSLAFDRIAPLLNENENAVFKRGRNSVHSGVPRNATPAQYRRATGFEALFGYLYLSGQSERLRELFRIAFFENDTGLYK